MCFRSVPITLLVVPPGQPTVDRHGPLFPALDTNTTLYFCTASVMTSQILLKNTDVNHNVINVHIPPSSKWTSGLNDPATSQLCSDTTGWEEKLQKYTRLDFGLSPWVWPVCRLPVTVVHKITLIVYDFNHLQTKITNNINKATMIKELFIRSSICIDRIFLLTSLFFISACLSQMAIFSRCKKCWCCSTH